MQLDLEFATIVPDADDFLTDFPATAERLLKFGSQSSIHSARQAARASIGADIGEYNLLL